MGIWKKTFGVKLDDYAEEDGSMSDAEWVEFHSKAFSGHSGMLRLCIKIVRKLIELEIITWNLHDLATLLNRRKSPGPAPPSSRSRILSPGRLLSAAADGSQRRLIKSLRRTWVGYFISRDRNQ